MNGNLLSMMDKSVQFLKKGFRIAYVPDKYKEEYSSKLNGKVKEFQEDYEGRIVEEDEIKIFYNLVEELNKNNVPVVVIKSNGNRIKVDEYNTGGNIIT